MPSLTVREFVASGLGDRLCGMAMISVYAEVMGYDTVYIEWPPYHAPHHPGPAYRKKDILLDNVLAHIGFPKCIQVKNHPTPEGEIWPHYLAPPEGGAEWAHELGVGAVHLSWFKPLYMPDVPQAVVDDATSVVRSQFTWTPAVRTIVEPLTREPFVGIHVRRWDKNFDMPITVPELERRTMLHLEALLDKGHERFFICGDDMASVEPLRQCVRESGASLIELPPMEDWQTTYFDLAVLSKTKTILESSRSSAFSHFAAFMAQGRLLNVVHQEPER